MSDRIEYEYPYWPDEITRLTDRVEAAEAELRRLAETPLVVVLAKLEPRYAALTAERDRYREALETIADWPSLRPDGGERAFARRALSEEQG